MGFYVRKSIKSGPFRFNLSKSGIGMSVGVPGFRVGSGPRGNYVHMGRHGAYYRASLGGGRRNVIVRQRPPAPGAIPSLSSVPMEDVTGASVAGLANSSPTELVQQMQTAANHRAIWPWLAALLALAFVVPVLGLVLVVPGVAGVWWLRQRDIARSRVVAFYDVNDEAALRFQALVDAFSAIIGCSARWQVTDRGAVRGTYQWKVNAGASTLVNRAPARASTEAVKPLLTNLAVPTLEAKGRTVSFLPDMIVVRQGRDIASIRYEDCVIEAGSGRFIETGSVPRDSVQVDSTWRYVNKNGTPDRRFNNNRRLPILQYGHLAIGTTAGFRVIWQTSQSNAASDLAKSINGMKSVPQRLAVERAPGVA